MSNLKIDLHHIFSLSTLQKGREYFRKNKVDYVELDSGSRVLFGDVRGSGRKEYEVEVFFNHSRDDKP